jgi:hypothetical protein
MRPFFLPFSHDDQKAATPERASRLPRFHGRIITIGVRNIHFLNEDGQPIKITILSKRRGRKELLTRETLRARSTQLGQMENLLQTQPQPVRYISAGESNDNYISDFKSDTAREQVGSKHLQDCISKCLVLIITLGVFTV